MVHIPLTRTLQELRRRLLVIETGAGAIWTSIAAIASLLAWMWLDLVLELSAELRTFSWMVAVLLAGTVMVLVWRSAGRRCGVRSLAGDLDAAAGAGGQILTGVELLAELQAGVKRSGGPRLAGALTVGLAEMAVDRAGMLASAVSAARVVSLRPLHRPAWILALLVAGTGAVIAFSPRLAKTQWLRFVDSSGDHPPYSRVWFDVQPGTTRLSYGEGLEITARPHGGVPERIDLVLQASDSTVAQILPMFPEPNGSWRAIIACLTESHRYHVRAARARSHQYDIAIQTVPRLEAIRFRLTPPAYARQASYDGSWPPNGLAGLPRTQIQVWAKGNRPLSTGRLDFLVSSTADASPSAGEVNAGVGGPATRPAAVASTAELARTADPNEVSGVVTLHSSGQLVVQVVDIDGLPSPRTLIAPVTMIPDERPSIRLLAPPTESLATPTAVIPVELAVEDDCGVSRLQLFRSLNDSRPLPMDMPLAGAAPTRWSDVIELRLASYGLQPGDEIKLYARVEDNDPDGAKGSESSIATLRIIGQADYERLVGTQAGLTVLLSKYQQADRRVESLLAEIERVLKELGTLPQGSRVREAERRTLKALTEQLKDASESIQEAAGTKLPYDLDRTLDSTLADLARKLGEAWGELEPAANQSAFPVRRLTEVLRAAAARCEGGRKVFGAEASEPLEHLAAIYPLIEDQARYVAHYERQRELTTRLAAMKGHDQEMDPAVRARMLDLEVDQRQLHDALDDLLTDIDNHTAKLPEGEKLDDLRGTARQFVDGVRESRIRPAMSEAQSALANCLGARAHQAAVEATETMARFIVDCQDMDRSGRMGLRFQPQLADGMGNTIDQLLSEAGLSSLGQQATGADGSYSVPRSMLQNVGIYGGLSTMANLPGGGLPHGRRLQNVEAGGERLDRRSEVLPGRAMDPGTAPTVGDSLVVPAKYRRKVGQYFERIADELPDRRPAR